MFSQYINRFKRDIHSSSQDAALLMTTREFPGKTGIEVNPEVSRFPVWHVYGVVENPGLIERAIVGIAIVAKERSVGSHARDTQKLKQARTALMDLMNGPMAHSFKTISSSISSSQRGVEKLRQMLYDQIAMILDDVGENSGTSG